MIALGSGPAVVGRHLLELGGGAPAGGLLALLLPGPGQAGAHHPQRRTDERQDTHGDYGPGSPRHAEALAEAAIQGKRRPGARGGAVQPGSTRLVTWLTTLTLRSPCQMATATALA